MIIRNRARCRICGDIVESTHTHDYRTCNCGALAVDGGHDYIRRTFKEEGCFEELSEIIDDKKLALTKLWTEETDDPETLRWRLYLSKDERDIVREIDEDVADMMEWESYMPVKIVRVEEYQAEDPDAAMAILHEIIKEGDHYFLEFSPEDQKLTVSFMGPTTEDVL